MDYLLKLLSLLISKFYKHNLLHGPLYVKKKDKYVTGACYQNKFQSQNVPNANLFIIARLNVRKKIGNTISYNVIFLKKWENKKIYLYISK